MGEITKVIDTYSAHRRAVISTFLVSFANFSTIGMIVGTLKGIVDKKTSDFVSKYVPMMLLSGILVSLLTADLLVYLHGKVLKFKSFYSKPLGVNIESEKNSMSSYFYYSFYCMIKPSMQSEKTLYILGFMGNEY